MRTWVDASTLIALDAIGEIPLLRELLRRIAITPEVAEEVYTGRESEALRDARGSWIKVVAVGGNRNRWTALGLGVGEASLFGTPRADRLVLDEIPSRTIAEAEGRDYVGLLGLLHAGVESRMTTPAQVRDVLRKLARSSFHMSAELYDEAVRRLAGRD